MPDAIPLCYRAYTTKAGKIIYHVGGILCCMVLCRVVSYGVVSYQLDSLIATEVGN